MKGCQWSPATTAEMTAEGIFSDIQAIYDWWDDHTYAVVEYEGFVAPVSVGDRLASWGAIKASYR
jgi:hypothetical protein